MLSERGLTSKLTGFKIGKGLVAGGFGSIVGGAAAEAVMGPAQTNAGTAGNIAGSVGGAVGGMALGRVIGGGIGAFFGGPVGVALFSMLGGVAGQAIGDKMFGDDVTSTAASANDVIYSDKEKAAAQTATLNSKVQELVDYQRAANSINSQSLTYQRDTSRNIKNLPMPN
jgi:predicted lipid-binding transport protein (Tim44 family)